MLTMDQLVNLLLSIYKAHTIPQRALDCGPGLGHYLYRDIYSVDLLRLVYSVAYNNTDYIRHVHVACMRFS